MTAQAHRILRAHCRCGVAAETDHGRTRLALLDALGVVATGSVAGLALQLTLAERGACIVLLRMLRVEHAGCHRLLHIHRNVPGVMSAINSVFSENRINISAQFLQTNDTVGYVVIDIDAEYSDIALKKLAAIESTIRCRVLF